MAVSKITISFKSSETELYDKIRNSSCSPAVYIKDVMIRHFEELESGKKTISKLTVEKNYIDEFTL